MRGRLLLPAIVLAALIYPPVALAGPGDLIVGVNPSGASRALKAANADLERRLAPGQLLVDPEGSSAKAREALQAEAAVSFVEPDRRLKALAAPNDPLWANLWGIQRIGADQLWPGAPVTVAVIDSGVSYTHSDLRSQMWVNSGEIAGNKVDDDKNGIADDVYGADWVEGDGDPMDLNSHGTHVAGTIAASANNSIGVAGVAPQAKIMALRFLDQNGSGYTSASISAIDYAVSKGAKVINNSWGGGGYSQALADAFTRAQTAGVLVVNAAGNSSQNIDTSPSYPAAYSHTNMISVAATDASESLASFSNYGSANVDLGAPGVGIQSTIPGGGYAYYNGTSMASPHVAGAAALLWGLYPSATWQQIKSALLNGGSPQSSLSGKTATGRRLSAVGAKTILAGSQPPSNPPATPSGPAPVNTVKPSLGRLNASTLRCYPGSWQNSQSITYSWSRAGTIVPGAASQDYVLSEEDSLQPVSCIVTAIGAGGNTQAISNSLVTRVPLKPRAIAPPYLVGQAKVGRLIVCTRGIWSGESPMRYSYRWMRDGQQIPQAAATSYRVSASDVGMEISCRVTATNSIGSAYADSQTLSVYNKNR